MPVEALGRNCALATIGSPLGLLGWNSIRQAPANPPGARAPTGNAEEAERFRHSEPRDRRLDEGPKGGERPGGSRGARRADAAQWQNVNPEISTRTPSC